jgi:hypothetical protein
MAEWALSQGAVLPAPAAACAAMAWRQKGQLYVTVVAKATFAFASDAPMTRVKPKPVVREEVHHDNFPARSIRFTPDLVPRLERADVLFTGHAHVPGGGVLETMPVRLGVFDGSTALVHKTLIIRQKGGFQSIPIVYERAYGGIGWQDNPYGVGLKEASGEPSIVDPLDPARTIGFGPISRMMPARKRRLGALKTSALRADIVQIPDAFEWEYFQAAPADQQTASLTGDEWIVMDGIHPAQARSRMRLPSARGAARVHGLGDFGVREGEPIDLTLDLLHIDGEERCVTAAFRASFGVPSEEALPAVRILAGVEVSGDPIAWPAPPGRASSSAPKAAAPAAKAPSVSMTSTITLGDEDLEPVDEEESDLDKTHLLGEDTTVATGPKTGADAGKAALPFQASAAPSPLAAPRAGAAAAPRSSNLGGTFALAPDEAHYAARRKATPFESGPVPRAAPPTPAAPPMPVAPPTPFAPPPLISAPPALTAPVAPPAQTAPVAPPAPATPPVQSAPVAPPPPVAEKPAEKKGSPWADAPEAPAPAPSPVKPPQKAAGPPAPSNTLKRGLYDRFGKP